MKSLNISLPSNTHFYAISIILGLLVLKHTLFVVLAIPYLLYFYKQKLSVPLFLIGVCAMGYQLIYPYLYIKPNDSFMVLVKEEKRYVVESNHFKYHLYSSEHLKVGDIIVIDTIKKMYDESQFDGDFDTYRYQMSKGIYGHYTDHKIEVVSHQFTPYKIIDWVKSHTTSSMPHTSAFVDSLVFGHYAFEEKLSISKLGIAHLFVLSGLHVTILIGAVKLLIKPLSKKHQLLIFYVILIFYLFITRFPISLLRACLAFLIYETLQYKKIPYTKLDALSITFIAMFIMNPLVVEQLGFILSFLISLFLILEPPKSGFKDAFIHTAYIQTLILPFIAAINGFVAPISFLISPLFVYAFNYLILPAAWLSLYRPVGYLFNDGFGIIRQLIDVLSTDAFTIKMPYFNIWMTVIYMFLWILFYIQKEYFKKVRYMIILMIFVTLVPYSTKLPFSSVTFLDVGQGDTSIIRTEFDGCVVVIDAFGDILRYLTVHNIRTVDYLMITHGDFDHYKAVEDLLMNIKVKQIVIQAYETGSFYETIKNTSYIQVKSGDKLTCKGLNMDILGPIKKYESKNNQSIVIQTKIKDITYLFTGDIEEEAERDLVLTYGSQLKSDIIKVPHHGSSSSSTDVFLKAVSPKIAMISSGRHNKFDHPHDLVIKRYKSAQVAIYETRMKRTISVTHFITGRYYISIHKN